MRIVLIDDDEDIRASVGDYLDTRGHETTRASSGEEGLDVVRSEAVDIVITDLMMPGKDGFAVLNEVRTGSPETEVIMITGHGDIDSAVKAMRDGAFDFFTKPIKMRELTASMERTVRFHALRKEKERAESRLDHIRAAGQRSYGLDAIVGESAEIRHVRAQIAQVAETDATTVLITGETGTGKEVVARAIHYESARASAPYVPVDCTAIPRELMESEFFGHEKGAFTDARTQRQGHFELANEGTLFLDEIGDMDAAMQVRLLRALEERQVRRVGGQRPIDIDIRVVSATNADLPNAIAEGRFREDLYYRLNTFTIAIPPLRDRTHDVRILARHFLAHCARELRKPIQGFTDDALTRLESHAWPGNVRELKNTIERAVIVATGSDIQARDLQFVSHLAHPTDSAMVADAPVGGRPSPVPATPDTILAGLADIQVESLEKAAIEEALRRTDGSRSQAAELLGVSRFALRRRLIQHGLEQE